MLYIYDYLPDAVVSAYSYALKRVYSLTGAPLILRIAPPRSLVVNSDDTNRLDYFEERSIFRHLRRISDDGAELTRREYEFMKCIGDKYSWRYIREAYDRDA